MKRVFLALLAILLISSVLISVPVSAESLYIRKIVSVVYDDSGSMKGKKWAYANYAMQAFCGMLNSDDQLFITYMSHSKQRENYNPETIDLSAEGIQGSIDSISKHSDSDSTPYTAVETAYNKLKSVNDSNHNTQYWLVVITDGEFDECVSMNDADQKQFLNENFKDYSESVMSNGTNPQVIFLGIGGIVSPDENQSKGIYTYSASDADDITDAMAKMADRISGRTRLRNDDVKKIDDNTMQVSSSIPLLNIVVFAQGSDAKITQAVYSNESDIPISREVSLSYPDYSDMVGGAFLLGDSQSVIGSGTYDITFDQKIDLDDVVILFEPALEMRMTITVNEKLISDYSELDGVMEGDKVSVSCKIFEMGTDMEIDPSLMPPGTKFEVYVYEDGQEAERSSEKEMQLSDYVLKNIYTEILGSVTIEGFNPIKYSAKFTPAKYVPKISYTISTSFSSDVKSIKFDNIADNEDLSLCFTVYADGVLITDPDTVKRLNPVISVSPQGNDGLLTYSDDGQIIFTPNTAAMLTSDEGSFDVEVKCTIDDGTASSEVYTVLLATYQVIPMDTDQVIKKTEFFDNQVSASFYITKDGIKLDKETVEKHISVLLNEEYADLKSNIAVSADGTITITPYSEEEHVLNFWNWWTNWAYYFGLEGEDITVTLNHAFGSADSTINVVAADTKYLILNVYLPLLIEILILAAIIAYIVRYITKARFVSNAVLYVGSIARNRGIQGDHRLELIEVHLKQFNKFKNLWNPFKELTVSANGVSITAAKGNRILCNEPFPWYSDAIRPRARTIRIDSPKDVVNYCQEHDELVIHEIRPARVMDEQNRIISQDDSVYYFARADITYKKVGTKQTEVIDSAVAFCYSTIQN
ncbi:MAG TPA: VWA domain-containing protein [Clostridiaceae bacterium]|nr:VWA domain-containing protein [Clostridiaceae bacterium]